MDATTRWRMPAAGLLLAILPFAAGAQAVAVNQTLDTVQAFGPGRVLERVDDPATDTVDYGYVDTGLAGSALLAAQLTAKQGLIALDGNLVVQWSDTEDPASRRELFSCAQVPGLDDRLAQACTGLTADLTGNVIWLAGRNKGRTHNLVKVVRSTSGEACPAGSSWQPIGATGYFACTWVTGRPLLIDITSIDGSAGEALNPACGSTATTCAKGPGILGLEERRRAVFFPTAAGSTVPIGQSVEIASGKTGWGLSGSEQLLGASLFQAGGVSYVVATSSSSRILRSTTDGSSIVVPLQLDVPLGDARCTTRSPQYGIRSSAKSGLVYVTDRDCRRVQAFKPASATAPLAGLSQVESLSTGTVAPEGPTIAAGRSYSLNDFAGDGGTLLSSPSGEDAAVLRFVQLADPSVSGLTLFQVQNIADCRWFPAASRPAVCNDPDVIHPDDRSKPATQQRLNLAKLLPREITDLYDDSGVPPLGLPPLYVQPEWRGQYRDFGNGTKGRYFEALFAITERGLIFTGTYEMELWIELLTNNGQKLGCAPVPPATLPSGTPLTALLNWDIVSKVSEDYIGIGNAPGEYEYQDTLINIGCGSTRVGGARASVIPYNLAVAPNLTDDAGRHYYTDDVFRTLLDGLYTELYQVTADLACEARDASYAPLGQADCSALLDAWLNGKDKLDKCFVATTQPKESAGDQNCQAFASQLDNFRARLAAAAACESPPSIGLADCDPANRRGELATRARTIEHVFRDRFLPSVPLTGFKGTRTPDPVTQY